jgi:hypothetical protein
MQQLAASTQGHEFGRDEPTTVPDSARQVLVWLQRQLAWEHCLDELRTAVVVRDDDTDAQDPRSR